MQEKFYWIPEAPQHPGLYANLTGTDMKYGKLGDGELQPSTYDPNSARKFITKEECQEWCNLNPDPAFEPKEHAFYDF
jgi:hypothetical protein